MVPRARVGTGARVCLADFGLARPQDGDTPLGGAPAPSRHTRTGDALGTPAYMSPEQARGEHAALTPAGDVWALGCLLHELLDGQPPFAVGSAAEVVAAVAAGRVPRLRAVGADRRRALRWLADGCLAVAGAARYPSAGALRDDCERLLRGEALRGAPGAGGRGGPARAVVAVAAAAGLAVVAWAAAGGGAGPAASDPRDGAGDPVERQVASARQVRLVEPRAALAAVQAALVARPERQDWRLECGLLAWSVGAIAEARAAWSAIPPAAPEAPWAQAYLGLLSFLELERDRAQAELAPLLAAPGPPGAIARGVRAAIAGDWPAARAVVAEGGGWEAALLQAYVETRDPAGDTAVALRAYERALAEGLPSAWVHSDRGVVRSRLGDVAAAAEDYARALALRPGYVTALFNRALDRAAAGDRVGAESDYAAILAERPNYADAYYSRGNLRRASGDAGGAEADYDRALAVDPGHVDARINRCALRRQRGALAEALADAEAALAAAPGHPGALQNRGVLRHAQGDFAGAIDDYTAALDATPDDPTLLANRGLARSAHGDPGGALADAERALARAADHLEARRTQADALFRLGRFPEAVAAYDQVLARVPGDANARCNRGNARRVLGVLDGALEDLTAAAAARPDDVAVQASLGQVHRARGELPAAAAAYRRALAIAPAHPSAGWLRRSIAECEAGIR
jgi:tetratricopeptide (TPR) repeat protein